MKNGLGILKMKSNMDGNNPEGTQNFHQFAFQHFLDCNIVAKVEIKSMIVIGSNVHILFYINCCKLKSRGILVQTASNEWKTKCIEENISEKWRKGRITILFHRLFNRYFFLP
jgi:hypothetical protein